MQHRNVKLFAFFLVSLLLLLQYRLWFQSGGIRDLWRLKKQLATKQYENEKVRKQNNVLLAQIKAAHHSQEAAEMRARQELGMVKKNEVFYQIVN